MDVLYVNEEQLRLLVSPRTREVFEALYRRVEATAAQLQDALQLQSKTIYYHLNKLEKAKLICIKYRPKAAAEATVYATVAKVYRLKDGFAGLEFERLAARSVELVAKRAAKRFRDAAEGSANDPSLIDDQFYKVAILNLKPERRKELRKRIDDVLEEFSTTQDTEVDRPISVVVISSPLIER